ncbi:hypothetical protein RKD52_001519 [Metabacillus sp. SLBN-84]
MKKITSSSAQILCQNKSGKKGGTRTFLPDSYLPVGAGLGASAFVINLRQIEVFHTVWYTITIFYTYLKQTAR